MGVNYGNKQYKIMHKFVCYRKIFLFQNCSLSLCDKQIQIIFVQFLIVAYCSYKNEQLHQDKFRKFLFATFYD